MTGYTVHTGTTIQFSEGWDRIFQTSAKSSQQTTAAKSQKPKAAVEVPAKKIKNAKPTRRQPVRATRKQTPSPKANG